ncbi:Zinc finger protein [Musa troglodytarum]|uniref:Zinc finger protein n=1 Tax=Musa troglodytarum TaxID=320322 RepID=A0A9E7FVP5_9LILI|nr:Zinc finger protein [Musa troglodytarum]
MYLPKRSRISSAIDKGAIFPSGAIEQFVRRLGSCMGEPSMEHLCDFCTEQRSVVYCQSDAASLCLSCDRNVHSANALSWRHLRTLLCDQCFVQPAVVRCIEENKSLCGNCDRKVHGGLAVASEHNRHLINCYSGCPPAAEFSRIWSFLEFLHMTDSDYEQGFLITNEDSVTNCGEPREDSSDANIGNTWKMNDKMTIDKCNLWKGSSSASEIPMFYSADQPTNPVNSTTPKSYCPETNDTGFSKDDFDEGFTIGDVDMIFENYEELFGAANKQTKDLFDDAGIDSFYDRKKNSPACSLCHDELAAEASSAGQVKQMKIPCNDAVSADSVMSNPDGDPDCGLAFPECKVQSSLSFLFSGVTEGSNAGDYQNCRKSDMRLMGKPPWYFAGSESFSLSTSSRESAFMRYKEKKKSRKFEKRVRYALHKARADIRRRVKGRFVKAGDDYDYDPLSHISC